MGTLASQSIGYATDAFLPQDLSQRVFAFAGRLSMARTIWLRHRSAGHSMWLSQGAYPTIISISNPRKVTFFSQTKRMMDYAADRISFLGGHRAVGLEWQVW